MRRARDSGRTTSPPGTVTLRTGNEQHQFRILFLAERVVQATDVQEALHLAESFGAVEITAVSRVD